ncbi:interaptin [Xiphias gladius]|uniref:interaptin n=1 Tax=Xiphias gladius TaxID=8245 RepID=UPI001A98AEAB|nr:interaptin [Xiphias gladius]
MAGGSNFIWIPLLLTCIVQASDNKHVKNFPPEVTPLIRHTGNSEMDQIFRQIPIRIPEGTDPRNINVTLITVKTCTDMKEHLKLLNSQLQLTTLRNTQLDGEAFGLTREVRQLKLQLATCSSTASAVTGSYKTHLHNKMNQLLDSFDSDTSLILKIIALTREVKILKKKIMLSANSTETTEIGVLQNKLQEKINELNGKTRQIGGSNPNAALILQIASLQNDIWDLEQEESSGGDANLQQRIVALQEALDRKIGELREKEDANSAVLELISLHSKTAATQRLISVHIAKSRTNDADYQRQMRRSIELLKKKIVQLNRDENNAELTKEILILQTEVEHFRQLLLNTRKITDVRIKELRVVLEEEKKKLEILQKELEETEYAQSQLIIKILIIMKDMRELQNDEQEQTPTSQATTLQALLQTKEREYAKAQADIQELQRKLNLKSEQCSGLEERYTNVKAELDVKIAELNRTGESKPALILTVITLYDEQNTLRDLISTTKDPDIIPQLQRQLEEKEDEINSKTADLERVIANPKLILEIIELQNEIWDLQKKATNGNTSNRVKELQARVDNLLSEIDGSGDGNTKLLLKIVTLQNQVKQLQRQLSDLQTVKSNQLTQLRNELTTKEEELQAYVNELNEKNQTNARLILTVTDLHNQLRNLEEERRNDNTTSSLTMTQLRDQLRAKKMEHSRDKAEINTLKSQLHGKEMENGIARAQLRELQRKLKLKSEQCSGLEERYTNVKAELDVKIAELNRTGESKPALILTVITLYDEQNTLRDLISTTKDPDIIPQLQRQLEEKEDEINSKTADLERVIANPEQVLKVIELQNEIWDLQKKATNGNTSNRVKELQARVDNLLSEIDGSGDGNTKLLLKIVTLQNQVKQLQRQLSDLQTVKSNQVTQLRNELTTKEEELQAYVNELNEKNQTNARLILTVTDLHNQLRNLQEEKQNQGTKPSATITNLREQLRIKVEQHLHDQYEIRALENKLNETEAWCSSFEQKIKGLQNDLDEKIKKLQAKSESVTSLALQVSTLTLQQEELKRQLQNTESKARINELQKQIDQNNKELAKKTEELKSRSAQPQRLLQIIAIQTEIEKIVNVAANETDYIKVRVLQEHLNNLIEGIQDEEDENTKLVFKILTQQDEITRLKKQEESQTKALLKKIKELEDELKIIRKQIEEKTQVLYSSDVRVTNLSSQIMVLHQKIKPLEEEISYLRETHDENLADLQRRLNLTKRQLKDSELRLQQADTKNFDLIMEIADLTAQLKKTQRKASKATDKNINELEQQVQTQQRENRKLEHTNQDLKHEVKELKECCNDANTHCEDLRRQLQESQEDADRLHQQNNKLLDDYKNLEKEKAKLEDTVLDLQNKINDVEDRTIQTNKITFDPDTAHPRLALSADNTEMSTSEELQNVQDHPDRYDVVLAALGKTGFSTGRHYWEVSVAGKLCYHLGMASESAPRRGQITFSTTNGFWTIVRSKQGQYRAADRRTVTIPVKTHPLTLGIMLDYKKGQISFYDAGARHHMYSFVGQRFTDKIYPFVNFCVEDSESHTPIVLLTPGSVDWIK